MDSIVASLIATVQLEEMTDFEKVKFVNDYIVKHTVYSKENSVANPHSAYAVAYERTGVCQGYALFAKN